MSIQFKKVLMCCLFVPLVQHATAEQTPTINDNSMSIGWDNNQIPIAWGDCIPVPVVPIPNNMLPPIQMMPPVFTAESYPTQALAPIMPLPQDISQSACDNSSEMKLRALQLHYNNAAAASKNKIEELTQALDDIHNQMSDARETIETLLEGQDSENNNNVTSIQEDAKNQLSDARAIIEKLSKELEINKSEIEQLKSLQVNHENYKLNLDKELNLTKKNMEKKLEKLRMTNASTLEQNIDLKAKLLQLEKLKSKQETRKLSLFKELDATKHNMGEQLKRLQQANSLAIKESIKAKEKILALEEANTKQRQENLKLKGLENSIQSSNKSLKEQLISANKYITQLDRKLAALSSSTQKLGILKRFYKERNEENIKLKKQLVIQERSKASLNNKLSSLQNISTLKGEQDLATIDKLKKELNNLDSANKSLKTKLFTFESKVGAQARKLTILGQTSTELTTLKSAYKERNDENIELKKQLSKLKSQQTADTLKVDQDQKIINGLKKELEAASNETISLKAKVVSMEKGASEQARKLSVLNQSAKEFKALQSAYKARNDETSALKEKLNVLKNINGSLNSELELAKKNMDAQSQKLTVLGQSASELTALQGAYKERNAETSTLKEKLNALKNTNASLNSELEAAKKNMSDQLQKLTVLGKSASELTALQGAYKERNAEISTLKKKLNALKNANALLNSELESAKKNMSDQLRKLTVLGKSASELTALQGAYKERNVENSVLKERLSSLKNVNISLRNKLSTAEKNAGNQARKLTALGQSASELTAIQSAYKERNDEVIALKAKLTKLDTLQIACTLKGAQDDSTIKNLKEKLAKLDNTNKTLTTKLSTIEAEASARARKLTALGKTSTELTALQSAYKERNDEADALKTELSKLKMSYGSDKAKLKALEKELTSSKKSINKLNQQLAEQQASIKSTNLACQISEQGLKDKLIASDGKNKSLLATIKSLESSSAGQLRKINALIASSEELDAIKSAYKELNNKNHEISSKLEAATADNDKDGVLNSIDKCPNSPEGIEVNVVGCFADIDQDGVSDSKDKCPASPVGSEVNNEGCLKIADADGDSIADANDLCPNTEEGSDVNQFGCTVNESITLEGVNFATGSARLTASSLPIIAAAAETIKKNPNLKIQIAGYTDNRGAGFLNKRLSQRRANTVMIQLIKNGVNADNLTAKGYGEKSPVVSNDTAEGRATNRRVELKIN